MDINRAVIIVLLAALAVTAGILIFVVLKLLLKKKEPAVDTSELIASVLDICPLPVFQLNSYHGVTQWNTAMEVLTGLKKDDMIGTNQQWKAFYDEKRPLLADMIVDGSSEAQIERRYGNKARKSALIAGAYEAEDFFPSLGDGGRWYHFTASPLMEKGKIVGAIEVLEDVTERHSAQEKLQLYAKQITKVQEAERKYLARELHDSTVQTLVALIFQLDELVAGAANLNEAEISKLKAMNESLKRAVAEVRGFSRQLRPTVLDDLGLIPAIEWLMGEIRKTSKLEMKVTTEGERERLNPDLELALFRVVQEALINAAKHSRASSASVRIEYRPEKIQADIVDNGVGFDVPESIESMQKGGHLGLAGIMERIELIGGKLTISSKKEQGTSMRVEVPRT